MTRFEPPRSFLPGQLPLTRRHKMRFGAEVTLTGTRFKVWAPKHGQLSLHLTDRAEPVPFESLDDGWHRVEVEGVGAGARYGIVLPDGTVVPDPASRYQPDDVHGFSEVVDPSAFPWTDRDWIGRPWEEAIIYELHIGTFTPAGTFRAAMERLDHLQHLG